MGTNMTESLQRAYDLIEAGDLEYARNILRPIVETDKDNPDGWWLYAHAVNDLETARLALNNVLRIDREYPQAYDLLKKLEEQSARTQAPADTNAEPAFVTSASPDLPGKNSGETLQPGISTVDEGESIADSQVELEGTPEPLYRRPLFFVPIIGLLLLAALAVVILKPFASNMPAIPTSMIEGGIGQLVDTSLDPLYSALSQFRVPDGGIGIITTELGRSGMADVCTRPGIELRETLSKVMNALAKEHRVYESLVDAIGARMLDCGIGKILLAINVPVSDAKSFADGSLSEGDFQGRWRAIR
jgi:hypothetical protein